MGGSHQSYLVAPIVRNRWLFCLEYSGRHYIHNRIKELLSLTNPVQPTEKELIAEIESMPPQWERHEFRIRYHNNLIVRFPKYRTKRGIGFPYMKSY